MSEKRQQIKSFSCVAPTFPDQDILAFLLLMSMMSIQYVCLLESTAVLHITAYHQGSGASADK